MGAASPRVCGDPEGQHTPVPGTTSAQGLPSGPRTRAGRSPCTRGHSNDRKEKGYGLDALSTEWLPLRHLLLLLYVSDSAERGTPSPPSLGN